MLNKRLILLILAIALISITSVGAAENSQNEMLVSDNGTISNVSDSSNGTVIQDSISNDADDSEVKSISLTPTKLSTNYGSGKYFKVKAVDVKTKKVVPNVKLVLKVYTGKKYKKVTITTDSKGIAKYSASKLSVGKHKIIVNVKDAKKYTSKAKTSYVKISKAKLKISAPKITSYYKVNKKFKITVKNKESKNPMKGVKVNVKVFTGKKYKKYSLKSNKNGVVSINTKNLKKGSHKVTVGVKATSKVKKASAKSSIKTVEKPQYIKLKVNGKVLTVKLVNNKATKALVEKLKKGDITIKAKEYGGFEKVGNLGFSLPTSDKYISTSAGDIVLYEGNQLSLFYDSNAWDYTKIGKVQKVSAGELRNILGTGDVKYTLSLK